MNTNIELNPESLKLKQWLPQRARNASKWDYGHLLIIGGDRGFGGAVRLAGEAALRSGAGMVTIASRATHVAGLLAACPELMVHGAVLPKLEKLLERATTLIIGPGLGAQKWGQSLWAASHHYPVPKVIDADGLNLLSFESPVLPASFSKQSNWILTPHVREAARLLHCSVEKVQDDRAAAVGALQQQYGGVVVLKGQQTLIKGEGPDMFVCALGNPGMATAGMGDVLSGVLGGLLAQKIPLLEAAKIGVYLHALSGDLAAKSGGERGMKASDLLPFIRAGVNV